MQVEFSQPLALLLFPLLGGLIYFIYRRCSFGPRGIKARTALVLRLVLTAVLCLALSGPSIVTAASRAATWVLLDVSDSTLVSRDQMEAELSGAMEQAPGDLSVGVIAFGGDAMVETPLQAGAAFSHTQTAVNTQHSDLDKALQLAGALLPSDAAGRLAVLSDGLVGDISGQAALLSARDIPVDVLTYESSRPVDAQVTSLSLPSVAYQNQSFQVTVHMDATADTHGTLILYANRQPVATREVTLRRGENTFVFQDTAKATGVVTYEAQLIAEGDGQGQNNRMGAYMAVTGVPSLLLVEGREGEAREIDKMLKAAGMQTEVINPQGMPETAEGLRKYDAAVLVNADADRFSAGAFSALDGFVRTLGRGLVVIGGDESYALGGYRGSALEKMLPVTIDVRNEMDMPSLALVLVIDKSGSMTDGQFGTTRLEVAKEAAARSAEVLTPKDQVGVIAFDDTAKWVVPLQTVTDVQAVQDAIGTIRPGGGTAFYTPLYEALSALMASDAQLKHVIFLTDGEAGDNGYEAFVQQMAQNGITLTTVAVGSGANQKVLGKLAEMGNGRSYAAGEFDNIPKIFTKETYLVTGSYVQNRTFTPVITEDSPLTAFPGFPQLTGYLAATEKPLTTVSLVSDRNDPVLSWWQYGAGRSLAWTSDSLGAWTGQFLSWDQGPAFFSGMVSHVLKKSGQEGSLQTQVQGAKAHLTYTAPEGADGGGLVTTAYALYPDGSEASVQLNETAPGVYEGDVPAQQQGAYAIRVEQAQNGTVQRQLEGGAVVSYPEEYDLRKTAAGETLSHLAQITGGRVLTDPGELFLARGREAKSRRELAQALLTLAIFLFLCDVAMRRLPWDRALAKAAGQVQARAAVARQAKEADTAKRTAAKEAPQAAAKPDPKKKAPAASAPDMAEKLLKAREQKKHL